VSCCLFDYIHLSHQSPNRGSQIEAFAIICSAENEINAIMDENISNKVK
jgi:hypothetical protein